MIKELEDYKWFPAILRRWQTEFIGHMVLWGKFYKPLVPVLNQMIENNNISALQDCCSGSGIPAVYVHNHLSASLPLLLTDKYPDTPYENKQQVIYSVHSVDILEIQLAENTCYTMYNAFHHFSAAEQKSIVQKFTTSNTPFLIAEILHPGLLTLIKIIFTTTIVQLLAVPFIKPFSFLRLFFTYIIPVNLFTVTYDGIISVLKSKTATQYNELLKNISGRSYAITVNAINNWKGNLVYIKGVPINK